MRALSCTHVLESLRISLRLSQGRYSAGGLRFGSLKVSMTEDAQIRSVPNIARTSEPIKYEQGTLCLSLETLSSLHQRSLCFHFEVLVEPAGCKEVEILCACSTFLGSVSARSGQTLTIPPLFFVFQGVLQGMLPPRFFFFLLNYASHIMG